MGFLSGSVSFSRFLVVGGAPKRLDQALLDKLTEHVIGKQREMRSDRVEVGWLGGAHVLDRDFRLEKNILNDAVHFGLRVDTARCPPDLLRAYYQMELDDLSREKGDGRITGRQKQEARKAAERRADLEVRQGRFHRMRQFGLLLDSPGDALLVASSANAVFERLYPLFRDTFNKRLERFTAGRLAYRLAESGGSVRAVEQLGPTPFVKNPDGEDGHFVYWTMHDPASRDFLGNEFLLWLWWKLGEESDTIELSDGSDAAVVIVRTLTLECPWSKSGRETIVADGPTRLPEAHRAVQSGKLPRKAGLMIQRQGQAYELSLAAETWSVSGAALPKLEETNGDVHGAAVERVEQIRHLCRTLDLMFEAFLKRRTGSGWAAEAGRIGKWLKSGE